MTLPPLAKLALCVLSGAATLSAQSTAGNWTKLSPAHSPPPEFTLAGMVYDAARHQVVLFGGKTNDAISAETWVWDGSDWTHKTPNTSPPARYGHGMAYDAARKLVVVFGGAGPSMLNDTWVWDGSDWSQIFPLNAPSARTLPAMVYDPEHGNVVLFGGLLPGAFATGDTWLWDGTNWTQALPPLSPTAQWGSAAAYDLTHRQVLMFGGQNTETGIDFWIWDGSVWTRIATMPSPPARYETALVYDSTRGRAVLFGGANVVFPPSVGNETWVWDGSKWLQEFPAVSPRVQCCHSMAYDPVHDQVLLFGATGETWVWTSGDLPGPTVTSVQSAAGFGGFSQVAPGSWIEIFGGNLAFSTRAWSVADFNGNNAPTSLDDVQVDIGGQKAFVDYESSSPGQINAQLPSNIPAGTLQLTVTNRSGTSQPFSIKVNKNQPGLLAPASFLIGGKQYAVAVLPGGSYALPSGTFFSAANRPAKPGETVTLYGIGFGAVTPDIPAGLVVTQSNQLAQAFELRIGGSPVELPYYGLAPGAVGLYQFNAVVPSISDNDLAPVTFTLDGVPGTQTLYIAVHQ